MPKRPSHFLLSAAILLALLAYTQLPLDSTKQQQSIMSAPPFIREIIPGSIITFSVPFSRGPVPFGGRSTAVKLNSGEVFLAASHPIDAGPSCSFPALT